MADLCVSNGNNEYPPYNNLREEAVKWKTKYLVLHKIIFLWSEHTHTQHTQNWIYLSNKKSFYEILFWYDFNLIVGIIYY